MPGRELRVGLGVNGEQRNIEVSVEQTLLEVLRDQVGLTGTKECCAVGECGACTVMLDGRAVNSCLVLAVEADGAQVTTIEGLTARDGLSPLQDAFVRHGAVQCGFCTPGMVVAAHALLTTTLRPTMAEIREGLSGNLCRCGCYNQICDAVAEVAGLVAAPAR
ncbi:MAG: (2Fe-2S)-binding protein [Chloroflexota bacterium]